jgi:hypothetical protein
MADPTNTTGLVEWWTSGTPGSPTRIYSDTGSTLVNSDAQSVQEWVGVNGTVFSQSTAAQKPSWDSGLGCLQFEITRDQFLLETAFGFDRRSYSAWLVCEFMTIRQGYGPNSESYHEIFSTTDPTNLYYQKPGTASTYDPSAGEHDTSSYVIHTSRALLVYGGGASNSYIYLNGTKYTLSTMGSGTTAASVVFGGNNGSLGSSTFARVFDVGFNNNQLSTTDLSTLLTYAQSRGVASSYVGNLVIDGDSITLGAGTTMNRNYPYYLGLPANIRQVNMAEVGINLSTLVSNAYPDHYVVGSGNDVCIYWAATNDFALGSQSEATVLGNVKTYGSNRRTAGFNKVIYLSLLPRGTSPGAGTLTDANCFTNSSGSFCYDLRSNYDAATLNVDALVELDQDPTIGGTIANNNQGNTTYYKDTIHLTNAGEAIVANLVYPFVAPLLGVWPASYTVTGPAMGTVGITSGTFTTTLVGGCTFNGTQSIKITCPANVTCNATAPGGTITNNGTGTVTVRPAAGQTGFTFTLTSTVVGAQSITPNGYSGGTASPVNRGWTDPAAFTFTVASAACSYPGGLSNLRPLALPTIDIYRYLD